MSEASPAPAGTAPAALSGYASLTDDDLVTGEGVALDLPPAPLGSRVVSCLVDIVATMLVGVALGLVVWMAVLRHNGAIQHIGIVLVTVLTFLVFPVTVETLTKGRSLGKVVMKLRVVRDDGGPTGFAHAFARALVGVVEIYTLSGWPAFFSGLFSARGKRLGDYAAGTYVVSEKPVLVRTPAAQMPPQLAHWAAAADLVPPPAGLTLATRNLLHRWPTLSPHAREHTARALTARWAPLVSPPPPPGTPPLAFLNAVMAERRRRDLIRLEKDTALRHRLQHAAQSFEG